LTGVVYGAGLEYAFAPRWSAKLEYDHIDYLGKTLHFNTVGLISPFDLTVSARTNIVKAGVNYQLGGPDRSFAAVSPRPAMPTAAYNWSGCYAGVHAGGGVLNDPFVDFNISEVGGGGGIAGGQAGCNIQTGRIVWGAEGEAAWSGLKNNLVNNFATSPVFGIGSSNQLTSSNRWSVDLAARAGVAVDRALIYGKVGVATGQFAFSQNKATSDGFLTDFQNGSTTLTGLVLGVGIEYAFASNWSAKFEFDRTDYLSRTVAFASGFRLGNFIGNTPFSQNETAATNVAKAGVNYRFFAGGPDAVVAKY
jgi:outer membrane immunogenic protein